MKFAKKTISWKDPWLVFGILMIVISALAMIATESKPETPAETAISADTVIPKGFVLVPIELQNSEAMGSMMGDFGIVDLFTVSKIEGRHGQRVGKKLRLLRAPLNPQQYAVLVPEGEVPVLLSNNGPLFAALQNPSEVDPGEIAKQATPRSRVEYFKETP